MEFIVKEFNVSGIYQITNLVNQKKYIGSSVCLRQRLYYNHLRELEQNIHSNKKLQYSFNKHGVDNFQFSILEYCEREVLIEREQYYLDKLKPEYNHSPTAGNNFGFKLTEETKLLLSKIFKGRPNPKNSYSRSDETKLKLSIVNKGKKLSEETKQKMRDAVRLPKTKEHIEKIANRLKGYKHSEQTKKNMSIAQQKHRAKCGDQNN